MKNVNYIIGNENIEIKPFAPFCEMSVEFLNDVSKNLLNSPYIRQYTDLSALGFWARKANIENLKKQSDIKNKIGRGLTFHIAPSNIPVNSIFSYFFSLLAGNSNIVRLSTKEFPAVDIALNIIKEVLKNYPEIEKTTAFVKYERNDEISAYFSSIADCRMLWGGDRTIAQFKKFETKPRCVDITFSDRYSVCIINCEELLNLEEEKFKRLIQNFYNDTYLMDQNACSSPQLIYWLNDNKIVKEKFYNAVFEYIKEKYNLQDALAVDKYTKLCEDAIDFDYIEKTTRTTNLLYRSEIKKLNKDVVNLRGKGGYFYEYSLKNIDEFLDIVDEKYQTVTYFGLDSEQLRQKIINKNLKGIDRIVPVGSALDIDINWDGYNLINMLSRSISAL